MSKQQLFSSRGQFARGAYVAVSLMALLAIGAEARAESVRTIDDKTIVGAIKGFEAGQLLVEPKPGAAVQKIPIAEIVEISLHAPINQPAASARPEARNSSLNNPFAVLGALFGVGSSSDTEPEPAEETDDSSAAPDVSQPAVAAVQSVPVASPAENAANSSAATSSAANSSAVQPSEGKPSEVKPTTAHRSRPDSASPLWQIELADGDHFSAWLAKWESDRLSLAVDAAVDGSIETTVEQVRAIWSTNESLVKKAKELKATSTTDDVVFVEKDGEVKSVAGIASGVDDSYLRFKFEGEDHRIKLNRVVGIVLSQREAAAEKGLFEKFSLIDGQTISGRIGSIERDRVRIRPLLNSGDAGAVELSLNQLATIDIKNGRLTWLGDLRPALVEQVPYLDRLMPYRVNQSLTGSELQLADGPITKGIAVHTKCTLAYDLGGAFERFRAKVGFQQPEGKLGTASLRILGDGKVLWQQPDARGDAERPANVDLDVAKVQTLRLEADYGANYDVAGRIVWGEARLVKSTP